MNHTHSRILLALLILTGAFLRVRLALDRPLWDDELWQRFVTREGSYLDFLLWRHDELVHPPLSFFLNRVCCDFFKSDAAWVWRLPSLLAGVLCIPAGFALGKRLGSPALALGIAAMLAFDLNTVWESANARMYSMLALGILAVLHSALPLLDARETSWRRAALLGVVLAALIWTHLLAALPWCALGLTGVLLLVQRATPARSRHLAINLLIAFGVACLLGSPGIWRFFAVREGVGAAVPNRSFGEILHLLYWVTNLLVWIEVRFVSPLVLALSCVGAIAIFRRWRAMSLLLLALGLMTALAQIHLLQTHPFSVMRYFIPAQPILWIGLPYLLLLAPPPPLRAVGAAVFCVFVGVQAWNCTRLESTYGTVAADVAESRSFVRAVAHVKAHRSPSDAVTYTPHERFAYRGEYFGLPAAESLGGPARPAAARLPISPDARGASSWIIARLATTGPVAQNAGELTALLASLSDHPPAPPHNADGWLVVHLNQEDIGFTMFPLK